MDKTNLSLAEGARGREGREGERDKEEEKEEELMLDFDAIAIAAALLCFEATTRGGDAPAIGRLA